MTPGIHNQIPSSELLQALRRHARCDWGTVGTEDWNANTRALKEGTRLFSVYETKAGVKFWIITEADRSATTALLPEEY